MTSQLFFNKPKCLPKDPMFLCDGVSRLIGMATAIYSPSGASAGVGFAIPVDTVSLDVTGLPHYVYFLTFL